MSAERRKEERHSTRFRLDYRHATGGNFLFEYTQNISTGGIFIETNEPLPVGSEVEMRFQPPGGDDVLELTGKVMWINPYRPDSEDNLNPGMGIQFENLSDEDKADLAALVKTIAYL